LDYCALSLFGGIHGTIVNCYLASVSVNNIAKFYRWELQRSNLSPTFTWARLISYDERKISVQKFSSMETKKKLWEEIKVVTEVVQTPEKMLEY
jgi:hypothetical protein